MGSSDLCLSGTGQRCIQPSRSWNFPLESGGLAKELWSVLQWSFASEVNPSELPVLHPDRVRDVAETLATAREMAATLDLKSKEEKDAELDKRIEALRRKNEALIRRYQEIEEDRKKAELEGVAVTAPRKGRMVEKENMVVEEKSLGPSRRSSGTPRPPGASRGGRTAPQQGGRAGVGRASRSWEDRPGEQPRGGAGGGAGGRGRRGRGRGSPRLSGASDSTASDRKSKVGAKWAERRRQNIEKMNEEMEKIAEYERSQREGVLEPNPVRNFLDDPRRRGGALEEPERDRRREGSRRHGRNWGGPDFERVRCGLEHERQGRRASPGSAGDMTMSMTGRERSEYLRWKQEREKIDQEWLQRHRKPTGQWRREWDAEKTEGMFRDGPAPVQEPSHHYGDDRGWVRPPKPPTFGEFLSKHKAEVSSRRRRKSSQPQPKAAPRSYSDHDDRWETKEEVVSPTPEAPQLEETPVQPSETAATAHRPPEDEGEEDEEWEDVSEDVTEDEEEEDVEEEEVEGDSEEEQGAPEQEEELAQEHQGGEAECTGSPLSEPAPETPSSPFSPPGGHQPVSDWGEEMELNSPRTAEPAGAPSPGGDQPGPASLESRPGLPGTQKAEEEGSEATAEAGPQGQETAEITDFQRVRFCKVVAAASPSGAAR
ncbi:coiled-coil domain-containing protein 9 isoform X3 [Octodon degus]|uniref:Coiled-coil domain-containing protein 9 isoform X3 n=1 Tax=Octodon degus TaxID=10160 RepID=A0A6P6DKY7_OCTDE|nr:coiled-coil domain-containing protein 9 isoform X3 [Octodon degus]